MIRIVFVLLAFAWVNAIAFKPLQVMCEVNGYLIPAMIDTGAEITVMSASCAKRCGVSNLIDTQHSGKAVGVGFSEIVGGIDGMGLRIGPLNFQSKISILRSSRCDFLIGLDILKRFKCDISLREKHLRFHLRGEEVRIPLLSSSTDHQEVNILPTSSVASKPSISLSIPPAMSSPMSTKAPPTESVQEVLDLQGGYYDEDEVEEHDIYDSSLSMEGV